MAIKSIAATRLRLAELVDGAVGIGASPLSIATGRVVLGHVRPAASSDFFASLDSDGPFLVIGPDELAFTSGASFGPSFIRANLFVAFDAQDAENYTRVNNLLHKLRALWLTGSYTANQLVPNAVSWAQWTVETLNSPAVIKVPITISVPAPNTEV